MSFSKAHLISNPSLLAKLDPHDAQALGLTLAPNSTPPSPLPSTKTTSKLKPPSKPELQSHAEFLHWIKKLNRALPTDKPLLALHADPTNPSGILPGWPDFTLFFLAPIPPLFIEFKREHQGRLSSAQTLIHRYLASLGHELHVVFSSHDAIRITEVHFQLPSI